MDTECLMNRVYVNSIRKEKKNYKISLPLSVFWDVKCLNTHQL